jgi:hypothetical protein
VRRVYESCFAREKRMEREGAAALRIELKKHFPDLETGDLPDSCLMAARREPNVTNLHHTDPRWPELMRASVVSLAGNHRYGGSLETRAGGLNS